MAHPFLGPLDLILVEHGLSIGRHLRDANDSSLVAKLEEDHPFSYLSRLSPALLHRWFRYFTMKASFGLVWKLVSSSLSPKSRSGRRSPNSPGQAGKGLEGGLVGETGARRSGQESNDFEAKNEKILLMTNNATSQVQEKFDLIVQLRDDMDEVKATTEAWKGMMDLLISEKEDIKEELASVKDQLRVAKDKADKWSRINDKLRTQLKSTIKEWDALGQEYTTLRSILEATSIDSFEVKEMLAQYKADVEVAEARLKTKTEYVKRLSWRETIEEIHAQGFDLLTDIEEAKKLEVKVKELYEPVGPEGSEGSSDESSPDED
uniref:Uncharacterized protein LOC104249792 n=1 Tax=Nicotiana sylvestris TaxID=4096 RepID=A0A1U7YZM1_NICSY|nr:PREDICTED: uncharacterized protein LOC104249792 [Nicotiana sylvestris]